ncbi:NAD-dependent epimerase/dehydratase family protein [Parabacteroides sp.]|uniref:NAD-dependent epimerase/dehydratase family protein n=1 Tax=Parabacteroides sp. TaxID=1869337 RepID=UPI00257BC286|nr:NAD-dependent epimerase/dehydratase family protein [Parabacteroides sp.]
MNAETFIDDLRDKNILITGASGLICSSFIDLLMRYNEQGAHISIYAMSRNEEYAHKRFETYWENPLFSFICHNVIDPFTLDIPFDYMVHGASNASPKRYATDPVGTMKSNIWGVSNLLELAKEKKTRLLYISSGEVYGEGDGSDFSESYSGYVDCLNPRACYPSSKRASETLCVAYKEQHGVDVVIARPSHIYGPDTGCDDRAFAQFLRKAKAGEDILLKSDGSQVRSYCHVDDCALALLYILLQGESGEAYNIANRESILSIKELVEMIANIAGVKIVYDIPSELELKGYSKVQRAVLDSSKLENLGWKSFIDLKMGITRILKFN